MTSILTASVALLLGAFNLPALADPMSCTGDCTFLSSGTWTKPAGVKYVVLRGCGGGSGGAAGDDNLGSKGGQAAPIITTVVGPLDQAQYQVTIGLGGPGGKWDTKNSTTNSSIAGKATVFAAGSLQVTFPPGSGVSSGQDSLFARGGKGGPMVPDLSHGKLNQQQVPDKRFGSGGDGGIGNGGDGGAPRVEGKNDGNASPGGICAGGGGGGAHLHGDTGVLSMGGNGGSGQLLITPLQSIPWAEAAKTPEGPPPALNCTSAGPIMEKMTCTYAPKKDGLAVIGFTDRLATNKTPYSGRISNCYKEGVGKAKCETIKVDRAFWDNNEQKSQTLCQIAQVKKNQTYTITFSALFKPAVTDIHEGSTKIEDHYVAMDGDDNFAEARKICDEAAKKK